jgi:hypothetical protein
VIPQGHPTSSTQGQHRPNNRHKNSPTH